MPDENFIYSNLSEHPPGRLLPLLRRHLPGVDRVESEIGRYAAEWHDRNRAALDSTDPLWVVLGDSISQGVGASSVDRGWVALASHALHETHLRHRVLNLSVSGARTADVIHHQIPAMTRLGQEPALVTVVIGSNDMVRRTFRASLADHYRELIRVLPRGTLVAVLKHAFGPLAEVKHDVAVAAAAGDVRMVPVRLGFRNLAEDHFHPDDLGHELLANDFYVALHEQLRPPA
ncbi:SGNH/GDSL hydrolase family protein [Nocardioides conyzicola]|uniref:Arylesterase n=1 Tax=Nocardioides conyzicola TaxID=1651781 RepID=A0ABP8WP36_9ACTN